MFFFFVGGLDQQVSQVLKRGVSKCINCGSNADLVNYDKVLKLFFVPVWRWHGKETMLHCDNCSLFIPQSFSLPDTLNCYSCSRVVDPHFKFCPFCGVAL